MLHTGTKDRSAKSGPQIWINLVLCKLHTANGHVRSRSILRLPVKRQRWWKEKLRDPHWLQILEMWSTPIWLLPGQLAHANFVTNPWSKGSQHKAYYSISNFETGVWAQTWTSNQWLLRCTSAGNTDYKGRGQINTMNNHIAIMFKQKRYIYSHSELLLKVFHWVHWTSKFWFLRNNTSPSENYVVLKL